MEYGFRPPMFESEYHNEDFPHSPFSDELIEDFNTARIDINAFNTDAAAGNRIRADLDELRVLKEKGEYASQYKSQIWESLLWQHGEQSEWFGENAHTYPTTEYDDWKNGIDFVIEWPQDDDTVLRLGIDATLGDASIVRKKESGIYEQLKKGELSHLKYYESDTAKGAISLPKAVIPGSYGTFEEIFEFLKREEQQKANASQLPESVRTAARQQRQAAHERYSFFCILAIEQSLNQQIKYIEENLRPIDPQKTFEQLYTAQRYISDMKAIKKTELTEESRQEMNARLKRSID